MALKTFIFLRDYFENFKDGLFASGKYSSVNEELKKGEKSERIKNFDRNKNLSELHDNFSK